jgi:hypothetical protein
MINMYVRILVALADKVLTHSRKLVHSHTTKRLGHRWPATHRTLRRRLHNHCGWFWDHVTLTESLDISTFGLSVKKIKFTFVDPIFVWLQQCAALLKLGKQLLWKSQVLTDPHSGDELFGSGVQYGLLLRAAQHSIPNDGFAALMNLSWDVGDSGMADRSVCPICLQVMNTNTGNEQAVGLLGYLPKIEVSAVAKTTKAFQDASNYVLQTCIGKILTLIEARAQHGFKGTFQNPHVHFKTHMCISKPACAFQNPHVHFKTRMCISKPACAFQNPHVHFKTRMCISKPTCVFQNPHVHFKTRMCISKPAYAFKTHICI